MHEPEYISLAQAKARFGVSASTLKGRIAAGVLPAKRFGKVKFFVHPADVRRLFVDVAPAPSAEEMFARLDEIDRRVLGAERVRTRRTPAVP